MFDQWMNILIISTHTDDAEGCMGGTIDRLVKSGYEVHHLVLSYAEEHAKLRGFDPKLLIEESMEANMCLGIKEENYHILQQGYPTDYFHTMRQEIANTLNKMKELVNPDVVFVNSSFDTHQDHQVVTYETKRIFKEIGIIGYEFPYNNLSFNYDLIVGLTEDNMEKKMDVIKCFRSQQDRMYFNEEYIYSLAKVNAMRMKLAYPYAEAFEVVRLVW